MEKKINQESRIQWRVVWIATGALTGPLLLFAIVAVIMGKLSLVELLPVILVAAVLPVGFALLQKFGRDRNRFRNEWILRDEGLEKIYSSTEREIILWEQIKRMFWTPVAGLIILYKQIPAPGEKPSRELKRGLLVVERPEATEIAGCWRKNCPRDEAERARQIARRRQIGIGWMCLGVVVACVVGPLVYQAYQSYRWPSVEGKIVTMEYEIDKSPRNPMGDAHVSYEYTVGGSKYSSDRLRPLSKGYRAEAVTIERFVNEHRDGMPVKVYYDPRQPADAVLLQGPEWMIWGPLLPVGPLLVLLGWRTRSKELRLEF